MKHNYREYDKGRGPDVYIEGPRALVEKRAPMWKGT